MIKGKVNRYLTPFLVLTGMLGILCWLIFGLGDERLAEPFVSPDVDAPKTENGGIRSADQPWLVSEGDVVHRVAETETSALMVVIFSNDRGVVIPSVDVTLSLLNEATPLGQFKSSELGEIRVRVPRQDQAVALLAHHPEYQPLEVLLEPPLAPQNTILLRPWAHISGVVVGSDGLPVTTQPSVLVHSQSRPPTKQEVRESIRGVGSPRLKLERATEEGEFDIGGLKPGDTCTLLVGGGGVATTKPVTAVTGEEGVVLPVDAVFGLRLGIEGAPQGEPALWHSPGPTWSWDQSLIGATGVNTDSLVAILLGLELQETSMTPSNPLVLLFTGSNQWTEMGPVAFWGQPAGYGPIEERIWIPRVVAEIPERNLECTSTARAWGDMTVVFQGLPRDGWTPTERIGIHGKIFLRSHGGDLSFDYPFLDWSRGELEIRRVPAGAYEAAISTQSGYAHYPAKDRAIEVGPEHAATVTFDLSLACEVELGAVLRTGETVDGELVVSVAQEAGSWRSSSAHFTGPPYLVQGLIPGRYRFTIYKPFYDPQPIELELRAEERLVSAVFSQP